MALSAIDKDGNPVDWWLAYKVPKLTQDANTSNGAGEHVYYDSNVGKAGKSSYLSGCQGALDLTLSFVFDDPADTTGWIIYNDEMPVSIGGSLEHIKGLIAFDTKSKTAFWLLHSRSKCPEPESDGMPMLIYGQTVLCISLDMETASKIIEQISNHQEPQVYLPSIAAILDRNDEFCLFTQRLNLSVPEDSEALDCISRGGLNFKVIAKKHKWGKEFWFDLMGATLGLDIDGEMWDIKNPTDSRQPQYL
jgi:deoxyribonuclease-2